ncbi:nuclear transport factor 2 family protein [Bradyrhizobium barranii]|uniref:YybH family protein n=1 Tax=Bradyrhizobium barranii TaxID=2992140 RepID=UPI0024AEE41C|nr:nuclear transport factor 2 family protein [Bradyrhizobium barranii]WFT94308.1 nuclear transport factor 2 family protein [Bradyrhizobium barranii]
MRTCFSCLFVAGFSFSAMAADRDPKQHVEGIASEYAASFNKQDGARIAALFATGGLQVNPAGPRSDLAEFYQGAFKAGINHEEITVDQAWPLGSDMALAIGGYRLTGSFAVGDAAGAFKVGGI